MAQAVLELLILLSLLQMLGGRSVDFGVCTWGVYMLNGIELGLRP